MPKISVVMPIFRAQEFVRRAIDSLKNQTFDDWELICINDCSPDNSVDIIREYMRGDKRIKLFQLKKNSGPGVVRNVGIKKARGEYVMFLDSDDFLHPQAMEIVYHMAQRDKSDVVTYTYDRSYRPQLMVRQILRMPYKNAMPRGLNKKYDLAKIKTVVTDKIIEHVTENSHPHHIKWPIKHGQVWKFFVRREFIRDIEFPATYVYEDIPWWISVVLKRPRATITQLPIYFYYPNFKSLVLSSRQLAKFNDLAAALEMIYDMLPAASATERETIMREFFWRFIIHAFHFVPRVDKKDVGILRDKFTEFYNRGMLDNPVTCREKRNLKKILKFISGSYN